jgi:hypothetical protein
MYFCPSPTSPVIQIIAFCLNRSSRRLVKSKGTERASRYSLEQILVTPVKEGSMVFYRTQVADLRPSRGRRYVLVVQSGASQNRSCVYLFCQTLFCQKRCSRAVCNAQHDEKPPFEAPLLSSTCPIGMWVSTVTVTGHSRLSCTDNRGTPEITLFLGDAVVAISKDARI